MSDRGSEFPFYSVQNAPPCVNVACHICTHAVDLRVSKHQACHVRSEAQDLSLEKW